MKKILVLSIFVTILVMISAASALPEILYGFNLKYGTFGTTLDSCNTCHVTNKPVRPQSQLFDKLFRIPKPIVFNITQNSNLNPYGMDLKNNLNIGISQALSKIENNDYGDKYPNIDKINNLTFPGEKVNLPKIKGKGKLKISILPIVKIDYSKINNYQPP